MNLTFAFLLVAGLIALTKACPPSQQGGPNHEPPYIGAPYRTVEVENRLKSSVQSFRDNQKLRNELDDFENEVLKEKLNPEQK